MTTFLLQMMEDESHFLLPEHTPKLTKLRMYVTPGKTFYELLSMGISTTRWHYNQGKCILAYNSHILYRTFKNLISTRSRSMPISALIFFFFCKMSQTYFFKLLSGNFTDLHETLHTASVDSPDKNVLK